MSSAVLQHSDTSYEGDCVQTEFFSIVYLLSHRNMMRFMFTHFLFLFLVFLYPCVLFNSFAIIIFIIIIIISRTVVRRHYTGIASLQPEIGPGNTSARVRVRRCRQRAEACVPPPSLRSRSLGALVPVPQ
eukprot:gene893-522_t